MTPLGLDSILSTGSVNLGGVVQKYLLDMISVSNSEVRCHPWDVAHPWDVWWH